MAETRLPVGGEEEKRYFGPLASPRELVVCLPDLSGLGSPFPLETEG
jgi:hypothetical protein